MVARSPERQAPPGPVRTGGGRPLLYPVPAADLPASLRARAARGARFAGAIFPLTLPPLRRGERYAGARLTVDLRHPDPVRALAVHADPGEFGLPPDGDATTPIGWRAHRALAGRIRPADRAAAVDGAGSARFGWRFTDHRTIPDLPRELAGHALLEIPEGVSTLLGLVSVDVDLTGGGPGRHRPGTPRPRRFSVPVPVSPAPAPATLLWLAAAPGPHAPGRDAAGTGEGWDAPGSGDRWAAPASGGADVAGTGRGGFAVADVLARLARGSGLGARQALTAPDGARFAALAAGTDVARVAAALATAVSHAPDERPRMRFALHRSLAAGTAPAPGTAPAEAALTALLEAAAVRSALAEHRDAAFALVVPDALFRDAIAGGDGPPDPAAFRRITADAGGHAWLYLRRPGLPG
ncbi:MULTISPECIES: hypothetical protein [Catenuloplanes]|uniref:Uncharacterized protein n=1 Tax=Catenuloplanes niger TaxID=587534 RepID=A0AAE3ZV69_9ACTN|nr:hypothetical protein [Catenuloplanes niger]MDR7326497.1 hypothetical protein [Catenuloplanes niger]